MGKSYIWPKKYPPANLSKINNSFYDNFLKPFKKLCFRSLRGAGEQNPRAKRRGHGNLIDFSRYWRLLHPAFLQGSGIRNDDIGIFQRSFLNQHNFTKGNI